MLRMGLLAMVGAAGVFLAGCSQAGGYPPQARAQFTQECTAQGAPQQMCDCALNRIMAEIPYRDYLELDAAIRMGNTNHRLMPKITEITVGCALNPAGG